MPKIKISEYAKLMGISHKTAWRWYRAGLIPGEVVGPRNIFIELEESPRALKTIATEGETSVYIYCRVSTSREQSNLDRQVNRVKEYCRGKGYQITQVVPEVASGMNDKRVKLMALLKNTDAKIIVVEHKDRLTRFGFNYMDEMLRMQGRKIEVVDLSDNQQDDLMHDLISIITSWCARLYGQRRGGQISKKTIELLKQQDVS
jgi:predicted site-specific integrase-resolvase